MFLEVQFSLVGLGFCLVVVLPLCLSGVLTCPVLTYFTLLSSSNSFSNCHKYIP